MAAKNSNTQNMGMDLKEASKVGRPSRLRDIKLVLRFIPHTKTVTPGEVIEIARGTLILHSPFHLPLWARSSGIATGKTFPDPLAYWLETMLKMSMRVKLEMEAIVTERCGPRA